MSMNNENTAYTYNGNYLALTKKETLTLMTTYMNLKYAKWNKPDTERQMLHNLIHIRNAKWLNL
jgi:hypothetical protein